MEFTAKELAKILKGTVEGNPDASVRRFAKIEHGKNGDLCFFANPKYEHYVYTSKASILLVNNDFQPSAEVTPTMVRVENAYAALADLLKYVADSKKTYRRRRSLSSPVPFSAKIGRQVAIGPHCRIGKNVSIGDRTRIVGNVYIGDGTQIGSNCIIYPGVSIYPGMKIGDRVILHSNCVIGSDGFGNVPQPDGSWEKIEHLGNVIIGNDVEIGSCTTVDRAPMESTIIGNGVKIDNLCQIAHNVQIGDHTVMAAQCGIAGSTKIGKYCILAGQVGIVGHLTIADHTTFCAQAGVIGNVRKEGEVLFGTPAIERVNFLKSYAIFKSQGKE